ncbi:MAG: AtpZ/AtpI family protein [Prolixibacteraceae bacterium]|nr:AtpZ/AtpI family protein [Prolixibacteraceae bacterium]
MKNQKQKNKKKFDEFIRYSNLGIEMMVIIAAGTFLGYKIDQWMSNEFKGFTLVFLVLSVIGSIFYATRNLLKK